VSRHLLTAKQILAATDCDLVDGDGLVVRINGPKATAVLRFTSPVTGTRREMGLGRLRRDSLAAAGEALTAARNAAEQARCLIRQQRDPIDERDRDRTDDSWFEAESEETAKPIPRVTLRRYANAYHGKHVEPVRAPKHAQQWINSIEQHVPAALLNSCIDRVTRGRAARSAGADPACRAGDRVADLSAPGDVDLRCGGDRRTAPTKNCS
jgi:hypothetical protein